MGELSAEHLRDAIVRSLRKQGYSVRRGVIQMPEHPSKDLCRSLNTRAVKSKLEKSGPGVQRYEEEFLKKYIANGCEVEPASIAPKLVLVEPESEHELLFRYVCLHWSIPVSPGYGRRLRFLVFDQNNGRLIGLFGLGDPVYAMQARDKWIGWDREAKAKRLYHVMDAYVLGAVPPYSILLGGKLVAMLVCSNEVREAFRRKYTGHKTLIRKETHPPYLALVTTTSAFGPSSVYNRIRANGTEYWTSVGFTRGSGEFHFANGIYVRMRTFVEECCEATAKHEEWGSGFRNKREVVRKCLSEVGLSADLIYHGIRREVFAAPLGRDAVRFLRCEVGRPCFYDWPASELADLFAERWLLSRAERVPEYREYDREHYRLWAPRRTSTTGGRG